MNLHAPWYTYQNTVLSLQVYVQPGAKTNEIIGLHNNVLKIKLAARAVEGCANAALVGYLAERFQVPKNQVVLKRGQKGRYKCVTIQGSLLLPESLLS